MKEGEGGNARVLLVVVVCCCCMRCGLCGVVVRKQIIIRQCEGVNTNNPLGGKDLDHRHGPAWCWGGHLSWRCWSSVVMS